MDTLEHTELGNEVRLDNIKNNPYLREESGIFYIRLQRFGKDNIPEPMELELSLGEIIAMSSDFFTQANWSMELDLPNCDNFRSTTDLGKYLINKSVDVKEEAALIKAYNNLAAPDVNRKKIDKIYKITKADYVPFSPTLNSYVKQMMYFLRVKNYGEMLIRNQTHFTPWSVRVYIIGHSIALKQAQIACELKKWADNIDYHSEDTEVQAIKNSFLSTKETPSREEIFDLVHRYHAQAISIESYALHQYTDHFAGGHMRMMGDLRKVLQEDFGIWGSILANNLHDEINRIGVFTCRPYDPTPDDREVAIGSRGDGKVDSCLNEANRAACVSGMNASMKDIANVLNGHPIPQQNDFGGLEHMLDVDFNSRQHQPLLVLSENKVFYRKKLSEITVLSPAEYEQLRANPLDNGYKELTSTFKAFKLVSKLRLLPKIYSGEVQPVSDLKKEEILQDEQQRKPQRHPIPETTCASESEPNVLDWRAKKAECADSCILEGLNTHSLLKAKSLANAGDDEEETSEIFLRRLGA